MLSTLDLVSLSRERCDVGIISPPQDAGMEVQELFETCLEAAHLVNGGALSSCCQGQGANWDPLPWYMMSRQMGE